LGRGERFPALDVLRGVAVFGILFVNIEDFSMIGPARHDPRYGGEGPVNEFIWLLTHLLADTKFIALFSLLFGAGIALMHDRARSTGGSVTAVHYRRMFALIAIGLFHAHLIWDGDILFFYGMCGLILYPAPKLPVPILVFAGTVLIALDAQWFGWSPNTVPSRFYWEQRAALTGAWSEEIYWRSWKALQMEIAGLFYFTAQSCGLMLIGMVLAKTRTLQGSGPIRLYGLACLVGFSVGVWLTGNASQWVGDFSDPSRWMWVYWGGLLVAVGWGAFAISLSKLAAEWLPVRMLASVGRLALTNYLMQSLICTTIFYGHGLGLFEQVERTGQLGIVLAICAVQACLSHLWLTRFALGPMEWIWRCASYWQWQPLVRKTASF
jgi:uncharacterized protein